MKRERMVFLTMFFILVILIACSKQDDFPVLKGSYLGQEPPGMTPEIFAPGIISTEEKYELNSVFSQKGDEFYYEISTTTQEEKKKGIYFWIIMISKMKNSVWTKPEIAPFSGKYSTMDMNFSPDGNRLPPSRDVMQAIEAWDGESSLVVQMAPQPLGRVLNEGDKTVHGIRIEMKT